MLLYYFQALCVWRDIGRHIESQWCFWSDRSRPKCVTNGSTKRPSTLELQTTLSQNGYGLCAAVATAAAIATATATATDNASVAVSVAAPIAVGVAARGALQKDTAKWQRVYVAVATAIVVATACCYHRLLLSLLLL